MKLQVFFFFGQEAIVEKHLNATTRGQKIGQYTQPSQHPRAHQCPSAAAAAPEGEDQPFAGAAAPGERRRRSPDLPGLGGTRDLVYVMCAAMRHADHRYVFFYFFIFCE